MLERPGQHIIMAVAIGVMLVAASGASVKRADASVVFVSIPPDASSRATDAFLPNSVYIVTGETVTWINNDSTAHTVTSGSNAQPDGEFDSSPDFNPIMAPKQTFSHTFEEAGVYPYYCGLHPNMVGKVVVQESGDKEPDWETFTVKANDQFYNIRYSITGGRVIEMVPSVESSSFIVSINATDNGRLVIELPREIVDARDGGADTDFVVFADEVEARSVDEIKTTDTARTLAIGFEAGTAELEIVATWIPAYPVQNEQTAPIVGKFLNSDPPKPDQMFKILYKVTGGTVEKFDIKQDVDDVFFGNDIVIGVNSSGTATLEMRFPRDFPYSNTQGGGIDTFMFSVKNKDGYPEDIRGNRTTGECFFDFSFPFTGSTEIEMGLPSILIDSPYHGDEIPDSCLSQTTVDVPVKKDGSISPLHQFRAGIAAEDVMCPATKDGEKLMLLLSSDGRPFCVNLSDEGLMKKRGWTEPS